MATSPTPVIRNTKTLLERVANTASTLCLAVESIQTFEQQVRDADARRMFAVALDAKINQLTIASAKLKQQ